MEVVMSRSWPLIVVLTFACAFGLVCGCNKAADKVDITGKYTCEGTNPDGKTYKGTVEVKKQGDAFHVLWSIGAGDNYEGIGILEGDVFSVAYYGAITGIAVYKVEKGKMTGRWTLPEAKGQVYTENWTK